MSSKRKSAAPYVEKTGRKSSKKSKPVADAPPAEAGETTVPPVVADAPSASDPDRVPLAQVMKKAGKSKGGKKPAAAKPAKVLKAASEPKPKKLSGLDAAAQVLAGAKEPMNSKDLIKTMADQGLWTSPGGKTPHATLYAAMLREITEKGKDARFKKADRGLFTLAGTHHHFRPYRLGLAGAFSRVVHIQISRSAGGQQFPAHEAIDMPLSTNRFVMLVCPGTSRQARIPFSLSEGDVENAIEDGVTSPDDPLDKQLADTAYYMVVTRRVCQDTRLLSCPWIVVCNGQIIGRNALAADISLTDFE